MVQYILRLWRTRSCSHCTQFDRTWPDLAGKVKSDPNLNGRVKLELIMMDMPGGIPPMLREEGNAIKGVPALHLINLVNNQKMQYDGDRSSAAIYSYLKSMVGDNSNNPNRIPNRHPQQQQAAANHESYIKKYRSNVHGFGATCPGMKANRSYACGPHPTRGAR